MQNGYAVLFVATKLVTELEKKLRNPDDKTRWLVDEEAAAVVRRTFSLCMQGKGVSAISTALWEDIASILENVVYIGVTESFKSTRLGFKSKKRIPTDEEMEQEYMQRTTRQTA